MAESEHHPGNEQQYQGRTENTTHDEAWQLGLDVPALEAALHASPEQRLDGHLGPGVVFQLGRDHQSRLELYAQVVRVSLPHGQLAVLRKAAEVAPEGVVFQDPKHFFLSVGPQGDVLFQYSPTTTDQESEGPQRQASPLPAPSAELPPVPSPAPAREAKDKAESERYLGRLGEVKVHTTKQGQRVAEVEITVADPDRPGASRLVKFVAFGDKAEALQRNYRPGQEVVAVGIPHALKRRTKEGQEWIERQLYFVQLPKVRSS